MPRRAEPPRLYYDKGRDTWCILHLGKRTRLSLAHGEADAARLRLAEYIVALSKEQAQAHDAEPTERPITQVLIDDVLELYLARRTDPDPTVRVMPCARPREAGQRVAKLAGFFGGKRVSEPPRVSRRLLIL